MISRVPKAPTLLPTLPLALMSPTTSTAVSGLAVPTPKRLAPWSKTRLAGSSVRPPVAPPKGTALGVVPRIPLDGTVAAAMSRGIPQINFPFASVERNWPPIGAGGSV